MSPYPTGLIPLNQHVRIVNNPEPTYLLGKVGKVLGVIFVDDLKYYVVNFGVVQDNGYTSIVIRESCLEICDYCDYWPS